MLLQETNDISSISAKRSVKREYIRNTDVIESIGISSEAIYGAIKHCYSTLDVIDEQMLRNNGQRLSNLVELVNLSAIVGNVLAAGLVEHSNDKYARNRPHAYPDLIKKYSQGEGIEIKVALETNKPKGHLAKGKSGYYLTFRYVLTDSDGNFNKKQRGDTVSIWEVKCGYINEEDFVESNTEGDSGKTATIKTNVFNSMSLVYFDPNIVPYRHSERRAYVGFN